MKCSNKTLIHIFLIIFSITTFFCNVSAQENETTGSIKQEVGITTAQNATFSSQSNDEENMIMAQKASLLGVLVGILTLIVVIVGSLGFLEIKKWNEDRKNVEKDVEIVREIKNKAEKELTTLREEIQKNPLNVLAEKPSEENLKKLD